MKIRIVRPDRHERYWYADRVGEEFEVTGIRAGIPNFFDVDISPLRLKGEMTVDSASVEFANAIVLDGAKAGVCDCGSVVTALILTGGPFLGRPANSTTLWSCENKDCNHAGTRATDIDKRPEWVKTKGIVIQVRGPIECEPIELDLPAVKL